MYEHPLGEEPDAEGDRVNDSSNFSPIGLDVCSCQGGAPSVEDVARTEVEVSGRFYEPRERGEDTSPSADNRANWVR